MTEDIEVSRHNAVRCPGISPRAYEHPVDRGALATLRAVPGFAQVVKAVSGFYNERGERLMALASSIRVGPKQYPELERLRHECAETLDLPVPNLFVFQDPRIRAETVGMDEPFIRISTGLVELMSLESLRFVLGHEMGHVLSGHVVYRTIMVRLIGLQLGRLMGGAVVTESIFAWPGVGRLMVSAIFQRDVPIVIAAVFIVAVTIVAANLLVDLVQAAIDPRIRLR